MHQLATYCIAEQKTKSFETNLNSGNERWWLAIVRMREMNGWRLCNSTSVMHHWITNPIGTMLVDIGHGWWMPAMTFAVFSIGTMLCSRKRHGWWCQQSANDASRITEAHLARRTMLANAGRSQLRITRRAKQWQPMRFKHSQSARKTMLASDGRSQFRITGSKTDFPSLSQVISFCLRSSRVIMGTFSIFLPCMAREVSSKFQW